MRLDLAAMAARQGARTAIRTATEMISYAELAARVAAASNRLAEEGVAPHDRVILACRPAVATVIDALALLELRCTIMPVAAESAPATLERSRAAFDPAWIAGNGQLTRTGDRPTSTCESDPPLQALASSGSSGQPKIVLRSAAQVAAGVRIFSTAMALGPEDRVLALMPFEHSFGFNSVMLGALSSGAEIVLPRGTHPRGVMRDVEESGATLFPAPPVFFDWMHRFDEGRTRSLGRVRACVSVGDLLPRSTYDAFTRAFAVPLWQSYGASEAGPALLNRTGAGAGDALSLGLPYPEVEVEVRGDDGVALADGDTGEIVVRSPAVGLGYLGEHDGASRIAAGEFFSGDLGVRGPAGFEFRGRKKTLIVRAGRKIDPAEVERVLRGHPDVADAAVHGVGEDGGLLRALVVARRPVAPADLIDLCARELEPHKVPRSIEFRSTLPRDGAGKLQRGKLSDW